MALDSLPNVVRISLSLCDSHCYFLYVFFEFEKKWQMKYCPDMSGQKAKWQDIMSGRWKFLNLMTVRSVKKDWCTVNNI